MHPPPPHGGCVGIFPHVQHLQAHPSCFFAPLTTTKWLALRARQMACSSLSKEAAVGCCASHGCSRRRVPARSPLCPPHWRAAARTSLHCSNASFGNKRKTRRNKHHHASTVLTVSCSVSVHAPTWTTALLQTVQHMWYAGRCGVLSALVKRQEAKRNMRNRKHMGCHTGALKRHKSAWPPPQQQFDSCSACPYLAPIIPIQDNQPPKQTLSTPLWQRHHHTR